jgi:glycosyltransferase involved in cell wall biosynthesis
MSAGRPRILEVLYSYSIGGSQLLGLELARQLKDQGAEVLCAALDSTPGPLQARCAEFGLPMVDLAVPWTHLLGRNGLSWSLTKRLRSLRLDALHLQHFLGLNKLGLPARLAGVKRIVVTEHSVLDVSQSRAGRIRARLNWRLASAITTVHPGIKDYLCTRLGVPAERISVIPVGIDLGRFHRDDRAERRSALGFEVAFVFAFVGRFAPVKRVPQLVRAFLAVQSEETPPARLLLIGDGEDRDAVRALVGTHPFGDRVLVVGEQSDVRPYLAAADAFVLNSSSEGMPRALIEAMAVGLPALCPAVGHIPELIAGRGWLTDPANPASLEQALRSMLEQPDAVAEAGRSCREFVEAHFDAQAIAERYWRLFEAPSSTTHDGRFP